ncbi:hypothetical protein P7C73_g5777, partial [Tremellales sp. Uapishka_1]
PPPQSLEALPTNAALEKSLLATTSPEDQLAVAHKEIERLKLEIQELKGPQVSGLRKRNGGTDGSATSTAAGAVTDTVEKAKTAVGASQGVPLEVVVALVGGVFVLTYLFF